ncbi:MAG: 50S ribosomal protein L29 [Paludibacteraceae bacterium]|jgi:large subunit ribosomal protein L29|nr:50S ribosomal protein L29 [Paludibacteraceae bacterium]MBR6043793.1 50S ribosomal protein L29 [Paludibacteraceae bacterium]MCR5568262.1 50S ribosomal protein L29 [Paludibacteraceae bacterium]
MKAAELKELSDKDLQAKLEAAVKDLNAKKLQHAVSPLENPAILKASRKDIARMLTELRARELNNTKN